MPQNKSCTEKQEKLIKPQIEAGDFGTQSENIRGLNPERQLQQASPDEIAAIRAALIKGEQSGFSHRSVDQIWEDARSQQRIIKGNL